MALEIVQREREGVILLDMKGRIVAGEDAGTFREAMERVTATPSPHVILNLRHVDYIDSTGLGAMVMCATRMTKAGGVAKLLDLQRRQMELLVMTRIDTLFEVFDDEVEAVNSFFSGREIRKFDILNFVQQMNKETQG